jgi:hypothetical protein
MPATLEKPAEREFSIDVIEVCHIGDANSSLGDRGWCGEVIDCDEPSNCEDFCPGCKRRVCPDCLVELP